MKKRISITHAFKDGILLILPFGVTLGLVYWGWSLLRSFIPDLSSVIPVFILEQTYINSIVDLLYLLCIILIIFIFGMLASTFLGQFFSFLIDQILMKPTFIRPIYTTFKKITESIFQQDNSDNLTTGISESVMIPYPNEYSQSIAFITSTHARHLLGEEEGDNWITVYVPSAPVVSAGFFLLCKKDKVMPCKLSSGQAMTTVISVGSLQETSTNSPLPKTLDIPQKSNIFRVWFLNGILLLTPISATIAILGWVFNHLYKFTTNISKLLPQILPSSIPDQYYGLIINIIITVILIIIIIIIGLLGESAFGLWIKSLSHKLFNNIPMFNKVYGVVEQITKVFSPDPSKSSTFDKAVLVPFPTQYTYAIGFITGKDSSYITDCTNKNISTVFIPTTPIPTTGWFVLVNTDKLIPLDISTDKAFGIVISGGILTDEK